MILRHIRNGKNLTVTAVLNLKSAYDPVPQDKLFGVIARALDDNLGDIVTLVIQPVTIKTQGDNTGNSAEISMGVRRGFPLSHTLFNMFMDSYVSRPKATSMQSGPTA